MKLPSTGVETINPPQGITPNTPSEVNFGGRMASGAAWMVSFKIIDRVVGIVSTAILARLLVPEDFGLIALAASVIAILELMGAFGLEAALVQRPNATRDHFDAVWTFNAAFGLCLGLVVAAIASPTAQFYGDPRLFSVMLMIGLRHTIGGFENVGIVMFRKELNFEMDFSEELKLIQKIFR